MNYRCDLPLRKNRIFFAKGLDFDLVDTHLICPSGSANGRGTNRRTRRDNYFARFQTNSRVTPDGVRGFTNLISSAEMDVMIRR
jgi:hypothetical protein